MSKAILGEFIDGKVARLDVPRLIISRALIQADSGSGKSWALRRVLEATAGKVQQFIIDPEGEFSTLREKFDLVIAAAYGGDALAHPKTARLLALRLLETGASAVLDLYELKQRERHTFVRIFLESMIDAPKKLWHPVLVAIDEAHIYCPEKGQGESEATDACIDLATRGRKRGFALLAATQRIGKFHKSAAAELKNKLIGATGLDIDVKRAAFELGLTPKEALAKLRALEPGHFFAFGPAFNQIEPRELVTGAVETTHPTVGQRQTMTPPPPTAAVKALLPQLADLPKEAEQEARSIEDLKRELATTRRELAESKRGQERQARQPSKPSDAELAAAERRGFLQASERIASEMRTFVEPLASPLTAAVESLQGIRHTLARFKLPKITYDGRAPVVAKVVAPAATRARQRDTRAPVASAPAADNGALPKGEAAVLAACIQYPEGLRREQLTVLTGYKRSSRDAYIQRLREKGFLELAGERVCASDAGRDALPNAEPLPTGAALQEYWLSRLPEGERVILSVLIEGYPQPIARSEFDERTTYKRSSRDAYLQRLQAKELVTEPARGEVRASDDLFN
jgi:hypothetical protein